MVDGSKKWHYAVDSIHMMHQYAGLAEQRVRALVGYYINQHPECAYLPLESVFHAFREGVNEDGLLDSKLPCLSAVMTKIPNTRQTWFAERLGIETIARVVGDANVFMTLNMDARAWPDVRQLIYALEHGLDAEMDANYFEVNTDVYTELMDKYSAFISIFLYRKVKLFLRAYLCDICRVSEKEVGTDWSDEDRTRSSFYWARVEFTETRGVQHWHCLVKLPNVLDTALMGRMISTGRVVRTELKYGNIWKGKEDEAWKIVEMGLLANRYVTLFAESMSQASFFEEDVDVDQCPVDKIIKIEKFRQQFIADYKAGNISLETHSIMRRFDDCECDANDYIEIAKVASVSCMHY